MSSRWQKIRALDWLEWRIILFSLLWLPWCALSLRLRGFRRTRQALLVGSAQTQIQDPDANQLALARRIARAVDLAAIYGMFRANCLQRSLVLCRQLHLRGLPHELKWGASLVERDFSAHAWVECGDVVINDRQDIDNLFAVLNSSGKQGR
jgi:hypothetical protein